MITHIRASSLIPAAELGEPLPANEPQGEPVAAIRSKDFHKAPDAGVCECTPGTWRRAVRNAEFAHFVAGHCLFHADAGQTLEIRAGDAVYFPANTKRTWEVIETVRKTFFLVPMV